MLLCRFLLCFATLSLLQHLGLASEKIDWRDSEDALKEGKGVNFHTDEWLQQSPFPSVQDTLEVAFLSGLVYSMKQFNDTSCPGTLPSDFPSHVNCVFYTHRHSDGTEVAILTSDEKEYVAVAYAGTNDGQDVLQDLNLIPVQFGPKGNPIADDKKVKVHSGFNQQVFDDGLYDRLFAVVSDVIANHPNYRIFFTGHSLGAANSILASVAFARALPHKQVETINFGSPRTGSDEFRQYANSFSNLKIWRVVHRRDLVPRLPISRDSLWDYWKHTGHTVQLNDKGAAAYYLHHGDAKLNYVGVPHDWNYPFLIIGLHDHDMKNYIIYLTNKSAKNPSTFFVNSFVSQNEWMMLQGDFDEEFKEDQREEMIASQESRGPFTRSFTGADVFKKMNVNEL